MLRLVVEPADAECALDRTREPDEFAERLSGGIGYIHLIDSDDTLHGGWTSTHAPFGSGFVKFDALVDALAAGYREVWWTIDLCFWPKAWEVLEESKKFMDGLLKRHGIL